MYKKDYFLSFTIIQHDFCLTPPCYRLTKNWPVALGLSLYFIIVYGLCRAGLIQRYPGPSGAHPQAPKVQAVLSLTSVLFGDMQRSL